MVCNYQAKVLFDLQKKIKKNHNQNSNIITNGSTESTLKWVINGVVDDNSCSIISNVSSSIGFEIGFVESEFVDFENSLF